MLCYVEEVWRSTLVRPLGHLEASGGFIGASSELCWSFVGASSELRRSFGGALEEVWRRLGRTGVYHVLYCMKLLRLYPEKGVPIKQLLSVCTRNGEDPMFAFHVADVVAQKIVDGDLDYEDVPSLKKYKAPAPPHPTHYP